jgi:hypothetical protein
LLGPGGFRHTQEFGAIWAIFTMSVCGEAEL